MIITIKGWHACAAWTWSEGDDEDCGICRAAFDGCAPEVKYPGDDSPVIWGSCGHAFHLQCIQKWLGSATEQRCPMCRRAWAFKGEEGEPSPQAEEGNREEQDEEGELQYDQELGQDGAMEEEEVDYEISPGTGRWGQSISRPPPSRDQIQRDEVMGTAATGERERTGGSSGGAEALLGAMDGRVLRGEGVTPSPSPGHDGGRGRGGSAVRRQFDFSFD